MKNQANNPFLPINEYMPDGEPHVFGDRVYLFGSHDKEGGDAYCLLDYNFYSAPLNDLSNWESRGSSYSSNQDPLSKEGRPYMYAPDVVRGNDSRYYLYYGLSGKTLGCYWGPISVAVSDEPDGPYEFYGYVRNRDGSPYNKYVLFDPALINDSGTIRLYYGTCYPFGKMSAITRQIQKKLYGKSIKEIKSYENDSIMGAITVELEDDMLTVKNDPKRIIPTISKGTSFEQHPFWEGSSIRKIGSLYYFIYSSLHNHELCYATSKYPDREFVYRGVIVSNGDIGLSGRKPTDRLNHTSTNHGSIECINEQWYVFYHRTTHASQFCRQACAEPITIADDGTIEQVEMTSSGLNGVPLRAEGEYPAIISCNLTNGKMPHNAVKKKIPNITNVGEERFITAISNGTMIGYKYFMFEGHTKLTVRIRGKGVGKIDISTDRANLGMISIKPSEGWVDYSVQFVEVGKSPLHFTYCGKGTIDMLSFSLSSRKN